MTNRYLGLFNILVTLCLFMGCSSQKPYAPVVDKDQPPSEKLKYHTVAPGETLYAIAWRYDLDYRQMAKVNGIEGSYTIYPGQRILLSDAPKNIVSSSVKTAPPSSLKVKSNPKVASSNPKARLKNKATVVNKQPGNNAAPKHIKWYWPASGKLSERFNGNRGLNKGIDITSNLREPVFAASSGTVVYSGEGLRGYGKLLIIKHSDKYLSAYAHNHRLLVKEGQTVKARQKIAEMGETGTDSVKLHFEIRYDGKPVDPLAYLPPR